jgi:hypothetical protein
MNLSCPRGIACDAVSEPGRLCRRGDDEGTDFEHKLKVKKIAGDSCRQSIFTESLILAQDERWRRA